MKKILYALGVYTFCVGLYKTLEFIGTCFVNAVYELANKCKDEKFCESIGLDKKTGELFASSFGFGRNEEKKDTKVMGFRAD